MGQKIHPLGFRLGFSEKHKAVWYTTFNQYASILKEDNKIRAYVDTSQQANAISAVEIKRNNSNSQIELNLYTNTPSLLVGKSGVNFKLLKMNIQKLILNTRQLNINIFETKTTDVSAAVLADSISSQLEKRIAFKHTINTTLQKAKKYNLAGIKIQISGRLNGNEIARSEWTRKGRMPLQTLDANIDYALKEAHTIYGVLGIKVWLFKF